MKISKFLNCKNELDKYSQIFNIQNILINNLFKFKYLSDICIYVLKFKYNHQLIG